MIFALLICYAVGKRVDISRIALRHISLAHDADAFFYVTCVFYVLLLLLRTTDLLFKI